MHFFYAKLLCHNNEINFIQHNIVSEFFCCFLKAFVVGEKLEYFYTFHAYILEIKMCKNDQVALCIIDLQR